MAHSEWLYAQRARALDADLATLRRLRWERPVLRGPSGEANASAEAAAALAGMKPLADASRAALAQAVYYGKPLAAVEQAALRSNASTLEHLRASTQHGWARNELMPELGEHMRVPYYPRVIDAALLLLAQANAAAPDECLRIGTDVMRLGQDLVPAGPPEALNIEMRMIALATPVLVRCTTKADLSAIRRTAYELHVLATLPPPSGSTIELAELASAAMLRDEAALSNKHSSALVVQTLRERGRLLEAWGFYDNPTRFRTITPDRYPDAIDDWKRAQDFRAHAALPAGASDSSDVLDRLHDDMRAQALLRALTIGVATLAERTARGKLPNEPVSLRDTDLLDPFRGKPLSYRVATDGSQLTLWAVGSDLKDDFGSDEWMGGEPIDVTVHFPLPQLADAKLAHKWP